MGFNIGDTVGDYQIIGVLGAGGMGKVYKVRNVISDRVEAVKVLLPDLANEPELADRFIREIKLLASLDHPNIAALRTAMRVENQLLMVMEFVEGISLDARVQQGPVPVKEALSYTIQMLSSLSYAHERGIIHRDIKPANMMVTPNGTLKLMDFGIAKAAADRRLTMTGTTMGSLYYMSPEQVKGSATIDGRADLYSVGVALYEIVTATRPFKGDSDYAIMVAHLETAPVAPIQLDPNLPPMLNDIILTAIQKDPNKRFQTANAFAAALGAVLKSLGGEVPAAAAARPAAPPPPPKPAAPPQQAARPVAPPPVATQQAPPAAAKSNRGLWMALGGLAVLAVIAAGALYLPKWYKARAGSEEPAVVEQGVAATAPAAQPAPSEPAAQVPAQSAPVETAPPVQQAAQSPAQNPVSKPAAVPVSKAAAVPRGMPARQETSAPAMQPAASPVQQPVVTPPPVSQPAPQQAAAPAPSGPSEAELAPVRKRLRQMDSRAATVYQSFQTFQQQNAGSGLGVRRDMVQATQDMRRLLNEAETAIKEGDLTEARTALDQAEKQIDKLDNWLSGRGR